MGERRCANPGCGAVLVQKDGEWIKHFQRRQTCNTACAGAARRAKQWGDFGERTCVSCGNRFARRDAEPSRHFLQRQTCSPECNVVRIRKRNAQNVVRPDAKTCPVCGKRFERELGQNIGHFRKKVTCSSACGARWAGNQKKRPLPVRDCLTCGSTFEAKRGSHRRYCSHACQMKGRERKRIERYPAKWCVVCGVQFERRIDEASNSYQLRRTCSGECRRRAQGLARRKQIAATVQPYPFEWTAKFRESIRARDGHTCALCGCGEHGRKHSVHHIDYDKTHCHPDNLITLCLPCHTRTNGGDRAGWMDLFQSMMAKKKVA